MGPCLSWAHLSSYLCMEMGPALADELASEIFGASHIPQAVASPIKILQGSLKGLSLFDVDTLQSNQLHSLEQMIQTPRGNVSIWTCTKMTSSFLGHVLN